jgi:hypothetical protein
VLPCGSDLALTSNHILKDEKKYERTKKKWREFVCVRKEWGENNGGSVMRKTCHYHRVEASI